MKAIKTYAAIDHFQDVSHMNNPCANIGFGVLALVATLFLSACGSEEDLALDGTKNSVSQSSVPGVDVGLGSSSSSVGISSSQPVSSSSQSSKASAVAPSSSSQSSKANSVASSSSSQSSKVSVVVSSSSSSSQSSKASSVASSSRSQSSKASSVASSSSSSAPLVNGDVTIEWFVPTERENGVYLELVEIGGYEIRYKLLSASVFTSVYIQDGSIDSKNLGHLIGDYEFQIATYDVNGLYSEFVSITPN